MCISFKKAFVIVLLLHGTLYGFLKVRSYMDKRARDMRDKEIAANYENNQDVWNNQGKKLRVLAVPKPTPHNKKQVKSFKYYVVDAVAYAINSSRELHARLLMVPPTMDYETKDTLDKIQKKIKPPAAKPIVPLKPALKPKPKSQPAPFATVVYRQQASVAQNVTPREPTIAKQEIILPSVPPATPPSVSRLRPVKLCPPPNFN